MQQKNGNLTAGVGGQYIAEMGKTDNCIVVVRTCFYDGQDLRKGTTCSVNIGNNYQNTPYIEAIRKS